MKNRYTISGMICLFLICLYLIGCSFKNDIVQMKAVNCVFLKDTTHYRFIDGRYGEYIEYLYQEEKGQIRFYSPTYEGLRAKFLIPK